jgi:hypothetical protein
LFGQEVAGHTNTKGHPEGVPSKLSGRWRILRAE